MTLDLLEERDYLVSRTLLICYCLNGEGSLKEIDVKELSELMSRDHAPLLLDVRTAPERELASIEPSILIPLHELEDRVDELAAHQQQEIVVYCHHGIRSAHAVAWLRQMGFKGATNLAGGIDMWSIAIDPDVPRY